jgi:hypothetical protein
LQKQESGVLAGFLPLVAKIMTKQAEKEVFSYPEIDLHLKKTKKLIIKKQNI